jgi:hypothetical protein
MCETPKNGAKGQRNSSNKEKRGSKIKGSRLIYEQALHEAIQQLKNAEES